jgi:hypothetical protein
MEAGYRGADAGCEWTAISIVRQVFLFISWVLHMALARAFWVKEKSSLDVGPSGSERIVP